MNVRAAHRVFSLAATFSCAAQPTRRLSLRGRQVPHPWRTARGRLTRHALGRPLCPPCPTQPGTAAQERRCHDDSGSQFAHGCSPLMASSTTRAVRSLAAHRYVVARYALLMASLRLACAEAQAYRENRHSTDQYEHLMAALAAARQEAQAYRKAQEEWLRGQGSNPRPPG